VDRPIRRNFAKPLRKVSTWNVRGARDMAAVPLALAAHVKYERRVFQLHRELANRLLRNVSLLESRFNPRAHAVFQVSADVIQPDPDQRAPRGRDVDAFVCHKKNRSVIGHHPRGPRGEIGPRSDIQ
jgi:hypothetical protein